MIWYPSELSALHLIRATAIFFVDCCQFGPSWNFGLKMDTSAVPQPFLLLITANLAQAGFWAENWAYGLCRLGWRYSGSELYFSWPYMIVSMIWNTSETVSITPQPCHSHFCCWWLPIWPHPTLTGPNWQQSTKKMAVARMRCNADSSEVYHIIYTII